MLASRSMGKTIKTGRKSQVKWDGLGSRKVRPALGRLRKKRGRAPQEQQQPMMPKAADDADDLPDMFEPADDAVTKVEHGAHVIILDDCGRGLKGQLGYIVGRCVARSEVVIQLYDARFRSTPQVAVGSSHTKLLSDTEAEAMYKNRFHPPVTSKERMDALRGRVLARIHGAGVC